MVALENGLTGASDVVVCPAAVPVMVGGLEAVTTTLVVVSVADAPELLVSVIEKLVVTLLPGAT
jgi:hypothetical protein